MRSVGRKKKSDAKTYHSIHLHIRQKGKSIPTAMHDFSGDLRDYNTIERCTATSTWMLLTLHMFLERQKAAKKNYQRQ